jgi:hypothetical protein
MRYPSAIPTRQSLAAALTASTAILAAYLYVAGWAYSYYYFQSLGISMHGFDMTVNNYLTSAFAAIWQAMPASLVLLPLVIGLIFCLRHLPSGVLGDSLTLLALGTLLVALFAISRRAGIQHAADVRRGSGAISVHLELKNNVGPLPAEFTKANAGDGLELILETPRSIYVLLQPRQVVAPYLPTGRVYEFQKSDVAVLESLLSRTVEVTNVEAP